VSEVCLHCDEPVLTGERSEVTSYLDASGVLASRTVHWECGARAVVGSVGHQLGKCSCHGGTEEDPPGMSKREAARAACALYRSRI
jgi:hypothetical protein